MVTSTTSWIIDSGASDHMTGCHELFVEYIHCSGNIKIQTITTMLSNMTLKSVLHVLNLTCNPV